MQEVKIADVSIKEGTNQHGPWTNTMVTGEDGSKFGTFHKSATEIKKGDVIKLEPVIKAGKTNFDSFEFVSKGPGHNGGSPVTEGAPAGSAYKRDTEGIRFEYGLKAHLQSIERASIEAQTAYNGIIELAKGATIEGQNDLREAVTEAIAWARKKMAASLGTSVRSEPARSKSGDSTAAAPVETSTPAAEEAPVDQGGEELSRFPHLGALLQWCATKDIDRKTFMWLVKADESTIGKVDIDEAFQIVTDHLKEYDKLKAEFDEKDKA